MIEYINIGSFPRIESAVIRDNVYFVDEGNGIREVTQNELLLGVKYYAKTEIKQASDNARLRYITPTKQKIYDLKLADAEQYVAHGTIGAWLQAEMNGTGMTADQCVTIWNAKNTAWQSIGASIEQATLTAERLINASTDATEVEQIAADAVVELEAI